MKAITAHERAGSVDALGKWTKNSYLGGQSVCRFDPFLSKGLKKKGKGNLFVIILSPLEITLINQSDERLGIYLKGLGKHYSTTLQIPSGVPD